MLSAVQILGPVLIVLFSLWEQLLHGKNLSREEFMRLHHLRPTLDFNQYKCDVLMREIGGLKDKDSHMFIYTPWHQIYKICYKTWAKRHRNTYVWAQQPFKVLKCKRKTLKYSYREKRSYSLIEFHCSRNGYVDDIEDMRVIAFINT
ncbi:PREDICTED: epididymal secretory protein E3-beta [Elephantulus edwardii]|uniref:epididymal secretory protein E3-beta n=1 Tax=Elephantulus edwardii TaxID=28737 RepID=UPI0003F05891|nr:PREDICTED: epididymal secretory protein E3-beta [Elephantulus edwardii]